MCVLIRVICIVLIVMSIVFRYLCSLFDIWVLLLGLYTPDLAVYPFIRPLGFMNGGIIDPSMYMHCCG